MIEVGIKKDGALQEGRHHIERIMSIATFLLILSSHIALAGKGPIEELDLICTIDPDIGGLKS